MGMGPTCRKRYAKADVDAVANWDEVCTSLGLFASGKRDDAERIMLFEAAMANLDEARAGECDWITRRTVDGHKLCNLITHYVAAVQNRHDPQVGHLVDAIMHMGRPTLAGVLRERLYTVRIVQGAGTWQVFCPYNDVFRNLMWAGRIGRWDKEVKAYSVPDANKHALFQALKSAYSGTNAHGPKGEFRL